MAEQLGLPIETLRTYHKRATQARNEGWGATTWRMPAPDAPPDVSSRGHPRWRQKTADDYIAAKKRPRRELELPIDVERPGKYNPHTSGGIELTDEVVKQIAAEAERGYDLSQLSERERRDLADEHRDEVVEGSGRPVTPRELPGGPVMVRLTKAEKKLATEVLGSEFWNAINHGPPGWSAAMAPDRADDLAAALMAAWREHDQPVYELAQRFADGEERVPARRTKRGGWAAGVRTGDRTE
jgi:hypothetical protein